ncbi:MAG: hypothetical protein KatS3mg115_0289 [Candidatus Poribacteria bacterium]|nr:MAG: hypothetical protein KatS3mg115_0289 [Candidatus Poribacteria bacterium]
MEAVVFYLLAGVAVVFAGVVVTTRNVVHAAFALMVSLGAVAGFYVLLDADFLAVIQLLVYVGGILVLVLFGVMMTSGRLIMQLRAPVGQLLPATFVGLILLGFLLHVGRSELPNNRTLVFEDSDGETARRVARLLRELGAESARLQSETARVVLTFQGAGPLRPEAVRDARRAVERGLQAARPSSSRLYVIQVQEVWGAPERLQIALERKGTPASDGMAPLDPSRIAEILQPLSPREDLRLIAVQGLRAVRVQGLSEAVYRRLREDPALRVLTPLSTTAGLGDALMLGEFLLPFEVAGLILLVALMGAAIIARKGITP